MENNILEISKDILKQVNIIEIISHYIKLTKKGRNYTALCPFHDDKNLGNFYVSEEKQVFKCFACNESGNAISFVQKKEHLTYFEALLRVCEIAGIQDERLQKRNKVTVNPLLDDAYKCLTTETEFYSVSLLKSNEGKDAIEYLNNRGLDEEAINNFKIGYAQTNGSLLIDYLKNKNFSIKTIVNTGIAHLDDNPIKDINSGRIIFPIANKNGQIVGFSARVFKNKSDAKYVNTRETIAFNKSKILYNYHLASQEAKKVGYVYLLEGFMDVIACFRVGIKSALALMGTAITKEHLQLLRYLGVEIRLCLDLDGPGQNAMLEIMDQFDNEGLKYRLVSNLTSYEGKDSDEILSHHGNSGLLNFLNNLISKGEWLINYYSKNLNLNSLDGRKKLVNKIIPHISKIKDTLELEDYCTRLANLSKFSLENIKNVLKKYKTSNTKDEEDIFDDWYKKEKFEKRALTRLELSERQLMYYILENKEALKIYGQKLGYMSKDIYRNILNLIDEYLIDNRDSDYNLTNIINYLSLKEDDSEKKKQIANEITDISLDKTYGFPTYSKNVAEEVIDTINKEREINRTNQAYECGSKGKSDAEIALLAQNYINKRRSMIEQLDNTNKTKK